MTNMRFISVPQKSVITIVLVQLRGMGDCPLNCVPLTALGGELRTHEFERHLAGRDLDVEWLAGTLVLEGDEAEHVLFGRIGVHGDGLDGIAIGTSDTVEDEQGSGDASADGADVLHFVLQKVEG